MGRIIFTLTILFSIHQQIFSQDHSQIQIANEYYQNGELEKAQIIYSELAKNPYNIQLVASNYLELLVAMDELKEAESFLKSAIKKFPSNAQYKASLAALYKKSELEEKFKTYIKSIKKDYASSPFQLSVIAQHFYNEELYTEAIGFFKKARALHGDNSMYALELAAIYRIVGDKSAMIEEYLNHAADSPNRLSYVKNILQNFIQEEEDQQQLEATLIHRMQQDPDNVKYPELLIWLELQRKNFYGAFLQARAIDKRNETPGNRTMQIGKIALDNKSYDDAEEIFAYVTNEYPHGRNYARAKQMWMRAREQKIKNSYPVDSEEIRTLTDQYGLLFKELYPSRAAFESLRNKALLHAFYLGEIDTASKLLSELINNPRAGRLLISKSKLDLGDIYLLKGQPWESTLLYSQVEKSNKSSEISYDAKLRNARLNYFTGNFALAKGHLDILKKNTTRDISNDAIALGMLITDNTALDTTDLVMQQFANVELFIFQNKKDTAKIELQKMLRDHKRHSITDELYWLLSKLELEFGNASTSVSYLDSIMTSYSYDILVDDAAFKKAEIYDYHLKDINKAKELYQQFMIQYPGSIYVAEARKRFRKLRGDILN